jgi:hypothetical protein
MRPPTTERCAQLTLFLPQIALPAQKYTMEPAPCDIDGTLTCRFNKLSADAKGHTSAPVKVPLCPGVVTYTIRSEDLQSQQRQEQCPLDDPSHLNSSTLPQAQVVPDLYLVVELVMGCQYHTPSFGKQGTR